MKKSFQKIFSPRTESVDDYHGVLVPLAEANQHSSISANTAVPLPPVSEKSDVPENSTQTSDNGFVFTFKDLQSQVLAEVKRTEETSAQASE